MSGNRARPKRASEDYARTYHGDDYATNRPTKKPRFDVRNPSALAPDILEDDEVLEADVIGKRGQQVRRGAVNVDGFDSDSDNDNFTERADARAKAHAAASKSKEEDDNDMFADLEEDLKDGDDSEGEAGRRGGQKKAVRFLDADEIEGQVKSSKSGGHVSADFSLKGKHRDTTQDGDVQSSSDSEVDDEVRAGVGELDEELGAGAKKLHAPKLDAFNMATENEEGRFDDQGNYVRKAMDPDAVHDTWMEGLSKKDMRRAKEAHEKREEERRKKDIKDDATSTPDVLARLIPLLEPGETVLEALARFGKSKVKKPSWQAKRKNHNQNRDRKGPVGSSDEDAEKMRKKAIDELTAAADMLLTRGQTEVYEAEKELLIRQYRRETGKDWVEPALNVEYEDNSSKLWEYRWSDPSKSGEVHGPFDSATMNAWNQAGYFGDGVEFRKQNSGDPWSRVVDFI